MSLLQYNNKRVKLIDRDGNVFKGMAYYMDADTLDEKEDILDIEAADGEYYGFFESAIKDIAALE